MAELRLIHIGIVVLAYVSSLALMSIFAPHLGLWPLAVMTLVLTAAFTAIAIMVTEPRENGHVG